MAAEYLEIAKTSERDTRTLVRICHNFKNIVLVKESSDDKTELWHTKNSFIIPVNYIEPILEYTKQNDLFQLTRTPEKSFRQEESPYAHRHYGCITPIQTKKQDVKKLAKRMKSCIEFCENQLGQLEEVEQISNFWNFDHLSCQVKKQQPRKKASRCSPTIFLMMSTLMKHHHWINVMPPSRRRSSYLDSKTRKKTFFKLIVEIEVCICCCSLFLHENFVFVS